MERQIITFNFRTRRLNIVIQKITEDDFAKPNYINKEIMGETGFIRTQRYIKEYGNKIIRLPRYQKLQMNDNQVTVEQKNTRAQLMAQIEGLRKKNDVKSQKQIASEEWIFKPSDCIKIKLVAKELKTCEVGFYFNDEKVGHHIIEELNSCSIYPYATIDGNVDHIESMHVFFDMSSSIFKVTINFFQIK